MQCAAQWASHSLSLTPNDLYTKGFEDGKVGKAMEPAHMTAEDYMLGYEDGKGSAMMDKPVSDEFTTFNDPPEGFEFTGVKRVPRPYEYYLTKGGNASYLTRERANSQTRHILRCSRCQESLSSMCLDHDEIKGRD